MKVQNFIGVNGRAIPNQFIIDTDNARIFQSYDTIIAKRENDQLVLDNGALNYSRTTSKYLYLFLNMNRKAIEHDIKSGKILLKNLN